MTLSNDIMKHDDQKVIWQACNISSLNTPHYLHSKSLLLSFVLIVIGGLHLADITHGRHAINELCYDYLGLHYIGRSLLEKQTEDIWSFK